MIEGKINDLIQKLASSEVIEHSKNDSGRVVFGFTVRMEDLAIGEIASYRLIGPYEADVQTGERFR